MIRPGAAVAVAVSTPALGAPAQATPSGPGVMGTVLSQRTIGSTGYLPREITIPAGQATGWHYHDGTLYGRVRRAR